MMEQEATVASHTLTYLRKLDRQIQNLTDLVVRQQDLIGRLDRNQSEGLDAVRREIQTIQRDVRELKSDMVLMENRIISAHSTDLETGARLTELEESLAAFSADRGL